MTILDTCNFKQQIKLDWIGPDPVNFGILLDCKSYEENNGIHVLTSNLVLGDQRCVI